MRYEAVRRFAIILISFHEDLAVLDDQQPGHPLAREKVIDRQRAPLEAVAELWRAARSLQRQRLLRPFEGVVRQKAVEVAE